MVLIFTSTVMQAWLALSILAAPFDPRGGAILPVSCYWFVSGGELISFASRAS